LDPKAHGGKLGGNPARPGTSLPEPRLSFQKGEKMAKIVCLFLGSVGIGLALSGLNTASLGQLGLGSIMVSMAYVLARRYNV